MEQYDNPWLYNDEPVTDETVEGYVAFVYCITNLVTKKKYIGKKRLFFTKTRSVKKKKKKFKVPSDWTTYYGSNKELQSDVEKHGPHNNKREILRLCKTLGESSYFEAKEQFITDAIMKPDEYYNAWLSVRVTQSHVKHLLK